MSDLITFSVRLPSPIKDWVDNRARENGRSVNSEINQLLKTAMKAEQPKAA
ncbi:Arc family DNA-binding protein [Mesorhizobium australicum]|uniref:Arc family DNA-binding protein n=1 Tax=Mesorhizobium australicum TaxID=536018 RepID=UPI00333CA982